MAISVPGIGSNLDVSSIVSQLMQIEQRPLLLLAQREAQFQGRLSGFGSVKGALSTLLSAAQALAGIATAAYRASSSDPSVFTATAADSATVGSHSIDITHLAQAQRLAAAGQTSATAAIGAGGDTTLTFSFGTISGGSFDEVTGRYTGAGFTEDPDHASFGVSIGASNNTLEGLRDAINAADKGVRASIVNDGSGTPYRLTLSVADTGAQSSLRVAVSGDAQLADLLAHDPADDSGQRLAETRSARDALLSVDGLAVSSRGNSITGVIEGVTLTLLDATDSPATLTVARDNSAAAGTLGAFVKAFNDYNAALRTATRKGATLQGNSTLLGIEQRLRVVLQASHGGGAYGTLSALGVAAQLDGTLKLDTAKLDAALSADSAAARATLASAGSGLKSIVEGALGAQGTIQAATDGIDASIRTLGERRTAIQDRLAEVEKRYRAQFSALDALLGRMTQTSSFLQQQLANLPGSSRSGG